MKRITSLLSVIMIVSLLFSGMVFASELEYDTFPDWQIQIPVPDDLPAVLDGGDYYIYTQNAGSIPYVMIHVYEGYEDESDFIDGFFTDLMAEKYSDLEIVNPLSPINIEGRDYYEIDYGYTVEGYMVQDRRVVKTIDDRTYMFASKEIEELDMTVDSLMAVVCANCVYLRDGEPIAEEELGGGTTGQTGNIPEVRWEMVESEIEEEGLEGDFVTFEEVGYEMWIPAELHEEELPEGQMEKDTFIGFYMNDNLDHYVSVQFLPTELTLEDFKDFLETLDDVADMADFLVNDNPFVLYFMEEADIMVLTTHTGEGLLEVTFYPDSDGDFSSMAEIMGASIRKIRP